MGTLHPSVIKHLPSNIAPVRKSVAELTDYCKQLIEQSSDNEVDGADQDQGKARHHFKSQNEPRDAASKIGRQPEERQPCQAQLKQQFPVSSGKQHVKLALVPISPTSPANKPKSDTDKSYLADDRTPRTTLSRLDPPKAVFGSAVAQRVSSIRRLQENRQDVRAQLALEVRHHETGNNRSN